MVEASTCIRRHFCSGQGRSNKIANNDTMVCCKKGMTIQTERTVERKKQKGAINAQMLGTRNNEMQIS
jgi:hypothetical protein